MWGSTVRTEIPNSPAISALLNRRSIDDSGRPFPAGQPLGDGHAAIVSAKSVLSTDVPTACGRRRFGASNRSNTVHGDT